MEVTTVFIAGRPGVVSVWHQDDGRWSGTGGSKMKRLLEALTRNKLTAVLVGLLVTAVIPSPPAPPR